MIHPDLHVPAVGCCCWDLLCLLRCWNMSMAFRSHPQQPQLFPSVHWHSVLVGSASLFQNVPRAIFLSGMHYSNSTLQTKEQLDSYHLYHPQYQPNKSPPQDSLPQKTRHKTTTHHHYQKSQTTVGHHSHWHWPSQPGLV